MVGWVGLGRVVVVCGLGWAAVVVFFFFYSLFFILFVGWVAMVLTSSSCNLGIDNFDSRQVPNILEFYLLLKNLVAIYFIYLFNLLGFQEPWSRFWF